jgi:hypothetical protein
VLRTGMIAYHQPVLQAIRPFHRAGSTMTSGLCTSSV